MSESTELVDPQIPGLHPDEPARTRPSAREQLAQVLTFGALVAAVIGALGPARDVRTVYSWPPSTLPAGTASRAWYTPLVLIKHRPEAVAAEVPCSLPAALPRAERPLTVLATARFPGRSRGLAVTHEAGELVVTVGHATLTRVAFPESGARTRCDYRLRLGGGHWSLEGGADEIALGGALEAMPVVSGLFSGLDLHSGTPPSIEVTTATHATETRFRQTLSWTLAAVGALAALLLVALDGRPRPRRPVRRALGTALARAHPADVVVGLVLATWWVLSPAFHDDGWVIARERMFSSTGGFPAYYNAFGVNLPNSYWLEWLQHWLVESSSALLVLRLPAFLCLAGVWVLCRWSLARLSRPSAAASDSALWALASVFLVGSLAWGMTLRPEPTSALLVTGVFACTVRFLERGTTAPLAAIAVLLPLAVTGHHAALAAFAPLLLASPALLRWARARLAPAATIAASAIALLTVLLFVGADLEQRRADAATLAPFTGVSWRNELLRYAPLGEFPYGTPLRRASVALIVLAVLAFVMRRRGHHRSLLDLPAASLGLALVLLIASPSKFPWHFGALLGIAALAASAETAHLRHEGERQRRWSAAPFIALGATILAIAWAWSPRTAWSTADLRTLDWTLGLEAWLSLATLVALLPALVLAAAVLVPVLKRNSRPDHRTPWRVLAWAPPLAAAPALLFTMAVLASDAAKTDAWTLTRQNLGVFTGRVGCGLADDLLIARSESIRPVAAARTGGSGHLPGWIPPAPVERLERFSLGPPGAESVRSPWFDVPGERFGLFVAGAPAPADRLEVEWGRRLGQDRVLVVSSADIAAAVAPEAGEVLRWRFLAQGELPAPASKADVFRVTLRTEVPPGVAMAVTAPVTYSNEPLTEQFSPSAARPLVFPNLVTYFPCIELPRLRGGVAEVPTQILVPSGVSSPVREADSSPFAGALDVFELERLPLKDSPNPPEDVVVFALDHAIPGSLEAPPTATTVTTG